MLYLSRYFWLCTLIFTLNQVIERMGYPIPWVHSYLDDLLCPGIVLGFALFFQQQFTFRNSAYRFSNGHALFFVAWYSLLFEVLFPIWDQRHFSDPWDVLAYGVGTLLFMRLGNLNANGLIPRTFMSGTGRVE